MKFFTKTKKIQVSHPLTAFGGMVIARKGEKIDQSFINRLREQRLPPAERGRKFRDTYHYFNFKVILNETKYQCLPKLNEKKEQVLNTVGSVPMSQWVDEELSWMERYKYHYDHTLAITALVTLMTLELHHDEDEAREAASCALTHDFGITRVPEQILTKVPPLDDREMKFVQEHPIYSYCLLTYYGYDESDLNATVAYEHHETLLGTGIREVLFRSICFLRLSRFVTFLMRSFQQGRSDLPKPVNRQWKSSMKWPSKEKSKQTFISFYNPESSKKSPCVRRLFYISTSIC